MKRCWKTIWLAAPVMLSVSIQAAMVTFDAPVVATNTSVLDIQFNTPTAIFVEAGNVGDSSSKTFTTAGGSNITFTAVPSSLGNLDMPTAASSTSGFYNGGSQWNASIFTNATDAVEWGDVLRGNAWHNNSSDAVRPLTLRVANLTIGQPYSISLFAVDQRSGDSQTRAQAYSGGFSGGTFTNGISDSFSTTNAIMVIGTFTADATYQDIFIKETDGIGNDDTTLAAYALFKIGSASDNDGDGLPGAWEAQYGLDDNDNGSINPDNGAAGDPDNDTYDNLTEFDGGSNPTNSLSTPLDTDADGLLDSWEITKFGNLAQTGDGDYDGDYATNEEEETADTDPTDRLLGPDADSDTIVDAWEIHFFTNITFTAGNGSEDFDNDTVLDIDEFLNDTDPTDPNDPYSQVQITWSTPVTVTNDTDILQSGSLLHAGNFRSDNATISVTNGAEVIVFENRQSQDAMGDLLAGEEARVIAGSGGRQVNAGLFDSSSSTVSAAFEAVLDGSAWEDGDPGPAPGASDMVLRCTGVDGAPLVEGRQYQIQIFYSDDRPTSAGRSQVYHDGSLGYTPSDAVAAEDSTYIVGTFTAGSKGYQDVYIQNTSGGANFPVGINAYVLRSVGSTVPPNIISFSVAGGSATLIWDSEAGVNYGVLSKTVLPGGTWTEVTNVPGAGASTMATVPAGSSQEFFRIEGN